ncbi:hypothetical protein FISHEDRAFT_56652 [Fistulina hepatica ATCC 64428]|uniref:Uncharacterized protein n=1 Tax=Fistulina hepatica ATCC 64428 TaxID=1128425 RepID=A0A0D7AJN1_9AGAR|nr:hypothetical protein FISHEDRAFT_56652 [Fistulina hepatica ATCC 64428]
MSQVSTPGSSRASSMVATTPVPSPGVFYPAAVSASVSVSHLPTSHVSVPTPNHKKPRPVNVFSNDGSFLEAEEKKKQEAAIELKKSFDQRFKKRGKRSAPVSSTQSSSDDGATSATDGAPPVKRRRSEGAPELVKRYV